MWIQSLGYRIQDAELRFEAFRVHQKKGLAMMLRTGTCQKGVRLTPEGFKGATGHALNRPV